MNRTNVDSDKGKCGLTLVASNPRSYHIYHDTTTPRLLSEIIIESVAAIRDVDPTDTRMPLADIIDPDALDALFTDTYQGVKRTGGHIVFTFDGFTIFAHSNGHIFIREKSDDTGVR